VHPSRWSSAVEILIRRNQRFREDLQLMSSRHDGSETQPPPAVGSSLVSTEPTALRETGPDSWQGGRVLDPNLSAR